MARVVIEIILGVVVVPWPVPGLRVVSGVWSRARASNH